MNMSVVIVVVGSSINVTMIKLLWGQVSRTTNIYRKLNRSKRITLYKSRYHFVNLHWRVSLTKERLNFPNWQEADNL